MVFNRRFVNYWFVFLFLRCNSVFADCEVTIKPKLKLLWQELQSQYGFSYLLTRRLTQDCLENLFSVIRGKGGNSVTPDSSKFKYSLRLAITNQLLEPSENSNCANSSKFLLLKSELQKKINWKFRLIHWKSQNDIPGNVQQCADSYVCSWICARLPHEECKNRVVDSDGSGKLKAVHVALKQYENATFYFHNEYAINMYKGIKTVWKELYSVSFWE